MIIYTFATVRFLYYRNLNSKNGQKHFNFKYNLTVYGTSEYDKYLPSDPRLQEVYDRLGPMFIFNSEQDLKLQTLFSSVLYSGFTELINSISFGIDDNINRMRSFYINSLVSSMAVIVLLFLSVWFPFIQNLNKTVIIFPINISFMLI